jgi:hypothetical protein
MEFGKMPFTTSFPFFEGGESFCLIMLFSTLLNYWPTAQPIKVELNHKAAISLELGTSQNCFTFSRITSCT